jgi:hypothetical protein
MAVEAVTPRPFQNELHYQLADLVVEQFEKILEPALGIKPLVRGMDCGAYSQFV